MRTYNIIKYMAYIIIINTLHIILLKHYNIAYIMKCYITYYYITYDHIIFYNH